MKEHLLIYGCYGYTGQLIAQLAVEKKIKNIILGGRDLEKTKAVATALQLPYVVFDLSSSTEIEKQLTTIKTVLHCAGPFKYTAIPMAKACIHTHTHYLDITGEIDVFETLHSMSEQAKQANIIVMPGVGFDVVPSDSMALYLKEKMPDATHLKLVLMSVGGKLSHGTYITIIENLEKGGARRENGKIINTPSGAKTEVFDFGFTKKMGVEIPWGDVSTAFYTTGIPNISVYNILPPSLIKNMQRSRYIKWILSSRLLKKFLIARVKKKEAGPDEKIRQASRVYVMGIATNAFTQTKALLEMPEGYWLTAQTAVAIAQRVMNDQVSERGFNTPAKVFGSDFILQIDQTKRTDL